MEALTMNKEIKVLAVYAVVGAFFISAKFLYLGVFLWGIGAVLATILQFKGLRKRFYHKR
jgi:hypothetical protein